jgi:hypothetical protein
MTYFGFINTTERKNKLCLGLIEYMSYQRNSILCKLQGALKL